ncbi:hypothetical protein EJ357_03565 [Streptomyces cyaneochromogenes]|uniref:SF3 helicase domain-containing protein n=1 Tax=Streptomyces cyaneochromogenes TaxID=2496836 RepID=A0A3S9M0B5_9ACTN|nr:DNA primase family protein [Streptomyces cyaneochromogenes]AZQ32634.1 hypothetical protein EJ357_03565 [Streptomyces cyaneochromogenes]
MTQAHESRGLGTPAIAEEDATTDVTGKHTQSGAGITSTGGGNSVPFTEASLTALEKSALTEDFAREHGVEPVHARGDLPEELRWAWDGPGMLFVYDDGAGRRIPQYRPDSPTRKDEHGRPLKYLFPADCGPALWRLRDPKSGNPDLMAEGTKQGLALARHAPEGYGVIITAGCWTWSGADLSWAEGREVAVFFDADLADNRDVWDAAERLQGTLADNGADEPVKFARASEARAREGIDDVLGRKAEEHRSKYIERLVKRANGKLPNKPRRRAAGFFDANGLLVKDLADTVLNQAPAALTREGVIALYKNGVYEADAEAFVSKVAVLLGNDHRSTYLESVKQSAVARLREEGRVIPEKQDEPVLNCANGMLNLITNELKPHSPDYLSAQQIPVEWHADAKCPHYEEWLKKACPGQMDDLEETLSAMLDPSRTPLRNPFLFGPTRSGKSTLLRIATGVVGAANTSAVTLHELSVNRFKAAELYGQMLNAAADLSGQDVEDLSIFKMLTGEDQVSAERKHQQPFKFTNRALFAFSANELPQVGEGHGAYFARIKPFWFGNSFAGHEDPDIERKMMAELEGILVRLVRAWQRRTVRGAYLPTLPEVQRKFETDSNRVRLFVTEELEIIPAKTGAECPGGMGLKAVHDLFDIWAGSQKVGALGRNRFGAWLKTCPGVTEVRISGARGFNVRRKRETTPATPAPEINLPGTSGSFSPQLGTRAGDENGVHRSESREQLSPGTAESAGSTGDPAVNGTRPFEPVERGHGLCRGDSQCPATVHQPHCIRGRREAGA